jgi:tRNA A-37 threonylcarbamoyl transferase component Bud32
MLLSANGLPLAEWLANGSAQLVKEGRGRAVYRVSLAEGVIYVKVQKTAGPGRQVADLFRGSAARRQWNHGLQALELGVSTATPLACGEVRRFGLVHESFFVTEAIDRAVPLSRFVLEDLEAIPELERRRQRRVLLTRLAQAVARVHEAGLRHGDFHAGNILVVAEELNDPNRPAIYLVDLTDAKFAEPLDWPDTRASLAVLLAEWFDRTSAGERRRFWREYLGHRPHLKPPPSHVAFDELDRHARAHSRTIDRGRDRRCLRANRDFVAKRAASRRLHAVRELPQDVREELLSEPEQILAQAVQEPVKLSHTTAMGCLAWNIEGKSVRIGFKRCRPRNAWKAICDRFRSSRAMRNWRGGHALLARRIATARPLAVVESRRSGRSGSRESYLAVQWIEGTENLHLWGWRIADRPVRERLHLARRCAKSLGALLGRMHAKQISHRDLKGSNLLVAERENELRTWLIDTDGVTIRRRLSPRRLAADLARLATSVEAHPWVTRSIRYRFLRAYARQFPRGAIDEKKLWRAVSRRSLRQITKKRRLGKRVL